MSLNAFRRSNPHKRTIRARRWALRRILSGRSPAGAAGGASSCCGTRCSPRGGARCSRRSPPGCRRGPGGGLAGAGTGCRLRPARRFSDAGLSGRPYFAGWGLAPGSQYFGRYIGQNELKPVAGLPPSFVHDKDVIAKIAQPRIPPSS
jgi:hypothetical protein